MAFFEGTLGMLTESTRLVVHFAALVSVLGGRTLSGG
jgi:hypothetical protein